MAISQCVCVCCCQPCIESDHGLTVARSLDRTGRSSWAQTVWRIVCSSLTLAHSDKPAEAWTGRLNWSQFIVFLCYGARFIQQVFMWSDFLNAGSCLPIWVKIGTLFWMFIFSQCVDVIPAYLLDGWCDCFSMYLCRCLRWTRNSLKLILTPRRCWSCW